MSQNQTITVLSNDPDITQLEIFNVTGSLLYKNELDNLVNTIPAGKLSKGLYFLRVIKENKTQVVFKLVVY